MNKLLGYGLVEYKGEQAGTTEWQLTRAGSKAVVPIRRLVGRGPAVTKRPADHIPITDLTTLELLDMLRREGWTWELKRKGREAEPYEHGKSSKIFRTTGLKLLGAYAHCLLMAEDIAHIHGIVRIEHGKKASYYTKLLKFDARPDPDGESRPALCLDDPFGGAVPLEDAEAADLGGAMADELFGKSDEGNDEHGEDAEEEDDDFLEDLFDDEGDDSGGPPGGPGGSDGHGGDGGDGDGGATGGAEVLVVEPSPASPRSHHGGTATPVGGTATPVG
eukprot:3043224-Pyramimonas_sp.AAC.1